MQGPSHTCSVQDCSGSARLLSAPTPASAQAPAPASAPEARFPGPGPPLSGPGSPRPGSLGPRVLVPADIGYGGECGDGHGRIRDAGGMGIYVALLCACAEAAPCRIQITLLDVCVLLEDHMKYFLYLGAGSLVAIRNMISTLRKAPKTNYRLGAYTLSCTNFEHEMECHSSPRAQT